MASSLLSRGDAGLTESSEQPVVLSSSPFPFPPHLRVPEPRSLTPVLAACRHPGVILLTALVVRCAVGLGPHSGMSTPPLYGDYEAQRHWMEITTSLPMSEWYFNTTNNDLKYWGLDYPPLTAYVSWVCGRVAQVMEPAMVALYSSRGFETQSSKSLMRITVLVCDLFIMIPAVWLVCVGLYRRTRTSPRELLSLGKAPRDIPTSRRERAHALAVNAYGLEAAAFSMEVVLLVLLQPGFLLIDHGHFQYNCVALGLSAWAVLCVMQGQLLVASVAYSLSLNFKHMSLYYAPAFFFFLLSHCFRRTHKAHSSSGVATNRQAQQQQGEVRRERCVTVLCRIACLGMVVIATFALMWGPLCIAGTPFLTPSCLPSASGERSTWCALEQCATNSKQILSRLFAFDRGLFEDKVSNIWCAISPVIKLRNLMSQSGLVYLATAATLAGLAPSAVDLMRCVQPGPRRLIWAMFNSAMAFFVFSYQVHEKSILLALLPMSLLIGEAPGPVTWFSVIATFSMSPLLFREGLVVQYVATLVIFVLVSALCFASELLVMPLSWTVKSEDASSDGNSRDSIVTGVRMVSIRIPILLSLVGMLCIHACQAFVPPPAKLPDLWTVMVVTYSCAHFILALAYGTWMQCHLVEEKVWDAPFYTNKSSKSSSGSDKPKTE